MSASSGARATSFARPFVWFLSVAFEGRVGKTLQRGDQGCLPRPDCRHRSPCRVTRGSVLRGETTKVLLGYFAAASVGKLSSSHASCGYFPPFPPPPYLYYPVYIVYNAFYGLTVIFSILLATFCLASPAFVPRLPFPRSAANGFARQSGPVVVGHCTVAEPVQQLGCVQV